MGKSSVLTMGILLKTEVNSIIRIIRGLFIASKPTEVQYC